jgi:hypothetical protein
MALDRNAKVGERMRRNMQRLSRGDFLDGIVASTGFPALSSTGGLAVLRKSGGGISADVNGLFLSPLPSYLRYVNTADSSTTSPAADTNFNVSYTLPAGDLTVGRALRIWLTGKYTAVLTPTLQLKVKLGANTIFDLGAQTLAAVTDKQWWICLRLVCRTAGASGAVQATLESAGLDTARYSKAATVTSTIDLTGALAIAGSSAFSTGVNNFITQELLSVEVLN